MEFEILIGRVEWGNFWLALWMENKEQGTTVILGRVVRRGVKRRHAHPLLSRLEKDYLNSPPYRSSPNLYEPHSALVSGVFLTHPLSLFSSLFSVSFHPIV